MAILRTNQHNNKNNKQEELQKRNSSRIAILGSGEPGYWRYSLHVFANDPTSSRAAYVFSVWILFLILLSSVTFVMETLPELKGVPVPWDELEAICISFFTFEYFLRLLSCRTNPFRFIISPLNVIDALAILPFYVELMLPAALRAGTGSIAVLRVIRLARVFRLFKLSKHNMGTQVFVETFHRSASSLLMLLFFTAIATILFGSFLYFVERGEFDPRSQKWIVDGFQGVMESPFSSIPVCCWWSVVAMTTVGYGDVWPLTTAGRIVASIAMLSGFLILALPITVIGTEFDLQFEKFNSAAAAAAASAPSNPPAPLPSDAAILQRRRSSKILRSSPTPNKTTQSDNFVNVRRMWWLRAKVTPEMLEDYFDPICQVARRNIDRTFAETIAKVVERASYDLDSKIPLPNPQPTSPITSLTPTVTTTPSSSLLSVPSTKLPRLVNTGSLRNVFALPPIASDNVPKNPEGRPPIAPAPSDDDSADTTVATGDVFGSSGTQRVPKGDTSGESGLISSGDSSGVDGGQVQQKNSILGPIDKVSMLGGPFLDVPEKNGEASPNLFNKTITDPAAADDDREHTPIERFRQKSLSNGAGIVNDSGVPLP